MGLNTIYQCLLLLHCAAFIVGESYYTIIAPGIIKPNRKYTVVLTLHDANRPCTIRASITGRLYNVSDEVLLQPFETKKIEFFPPVLDYSDYQLLAEGVSGCVFRNETRLLVDNSAGPKIYIQTDKAVYKPLDLVQFRVVILDEHTRPLKIQEPIRVEIYDNDNNRVKQFKDIALVQGVFTGKFQLSQQPVMGNWAIKVIVSGRYSFEQSKGISVLLYTLPKFSVHIKTQENLIVADPHITAEIYGKYTFNKYVEGVLTVQLYPLDSDDIIEQKTLDIDGLVVVDFHIANPKILDKVGTLILRAKLVEKQTEIQQNATESIRVRKERFSISIPYDEIEFRDGRPFRLKAVIKDWIRGPVRDSTTPVTMEHGGVTYSSFLNENGVAQLEFQTIEDSSFTVSFKDSQRKLPNFYASDESFSHIQKVFSTMRLKQRPRLGAPVEIEIRSSFNIPYLVYTVVGHGRILHAELIRLERNTKMHIITIRPSIEMIPESFVYVHYIVDGVLIYKEIILKFPMHLENQISIAAPQQVKPGEMVTLNVKAQPESYVGILAVDMSVYLLDGSYDIYKDTVLQDLLNDKLYVYGNEVLPGIVSGLITLTNAHYPHFPRGVPGSKGAGAGPLNFRSKFPETWIFENYFINNTETEIVLNIPETITTWRITAFSIHEVTGLGIIDGSTDITTFFPFFIALNLPYSVKRGEVINIPVTIFNYHNQSLATKVKMFNENMQFEFMESINDRKSGHEQIKSINIPANTGETVKFSIKPLTIGEIELSISARNSLYADGIIQKLKVEPEGVTKHQNSARYLSAVDETSSLSLDMPLNRVSESEFITLSVGGDFMIPSLENLNEMVRMPTGCGEQNMVNFAPNILILDYLKATGQYLKEKKLVTTSKSYIDIGYQQELSYRHANGGYSVFGEKYNDEASTWLTAYVIRFFIKASKYTAIEQRIINSGLDYLAEQQQIDGSFPYTGYLFYKELKNKYGFTAFVLLTFMEDRKYSRKYQNTIRKGLDYITSNLDDISDTYALSITATVLTKAKDQNSGKVIEQLQVHRKEDQNSLIWWQGKGNDVETTAYVLMALSNVPGNHLPILKWLVEQRNQKGGFKSTHDTVVGLEALVKYAQKYNNGNNWNLTISYLARDLDGSVMKKDTFLLNQDNALTLQQHELPKTVRQVNLKLTGSGYSLVQLSSQYNVENVKSDVKHFSIKINPNIYNDIEMDLKICFKYSPRHEINNSTNMVIMEANLPSGFKTEASLSGDLVENEFIQRVETKNDDTVAILYFDKLSTDVRHCLAIETFKAHEVEDPKPSAIVMYDYYNTTRYNSVFYTI